MRLEVDRTLSVIAVVVAVGAVLFWVMVGGISILLTSGLFETRSDPASETTKAWCEMVAIPALEAFHEEHGRFPTDLATVLPGEPLPGDLCYDPGSLCSNERGENYTLTVYSAHPEEFLRAQSYGSRSQGWDSVGGSDGFGSREEHERWLASERWVEVVLERLETHTRETGASPIALDEVVAAGELRDDVTYERVAPDEFVVRWYMFWVGPTSRPEEGQRAARVFHSSIGEWAEYTELEDGTRLD